MATVHCSRESFYTLIALVAARILLEFDDESPKAQPITPDESRGLKCFEHFSTSSWTGCNSNDNQIRIAETARIPDCVYAELKLELEAPASLSEV